MSCLNPPEIVKAFVPIVRQLLDRAHEKPRQTFSSTVEGFNWEGDTYTCITSVIPSSFVGRYDVCISFKGKTEKVEMQREDLMEALVLSIQSDDAWMVYPEERREPGIIECLVKVRPARLR